MCIPIILWFAHPIPKPHPSITPRYQQHQEPFLAVVVDPVRTCASGKVDIGAFRTYPAGHTPADARRLLNAMKILVVFQRSSWNFMDHWRIKTLNIFLLGWREWFFSWHLFQVGRSRWCQDGGVPGTLYMFILKMMVVFVISWVILYPPHQGCDSGLMKPGWPLKISVSTRKVINNWHIFQPARLECHCFMEEFFWLQRKPPRTIGVQWGLLISLISP